MRDTKSAGEGSVFAGVGRSKRDQKANPYVGLPQEAYWKSAVAELSPLEINDIYRPRFPISRDTVIAAAGSCFAQHIGRQFKARGYKFLDVEPPPSISGRINVATIWLRPIFRSLWKRLFGAPTPAAFQKGLRRLHAQRRAMGLRRPLLRSIPPIDRA